MGMYDTIFIKTSMLPVSTEEAAMLGENPGWQSKDLDCQLTEVYITDDGKLQINRWTYEIVPEEERPYPNHPGILGMCGMLKRVNEHLVDLTDESIVNFYTDVQDIWFEFNAHFEQGKLKEIVRVSPT